VTTLLDGRLTLDRVHDCVNHFEGRYIEENLRDDGQTIFRFSGALIDGAFAIHSLRRFFPETSKQGAYYLTLKRGAKRYNQIASVIKREVEHAFAAENAAA
jgi:hypothetical protein